jgi:predicted small lipoprotein YifL
MKTSFLSVILLAGLFSLSGCAAYKAAQTPDDVYYSPAKTIVPQEQQEYVDYVSNNEDQYLKMKAQNNLMFSSLDDYSYWYDARYAYGMNFNYLYSPYYSYYTNPLYSSGWGYSNPVFIPASYKNPLISKGKTGATNITAFQNKAYNLSNSGSNAGFSYYQPKPTSSSATGNTYSNFRSTTAPTSSSNSYSNPVRVSSGTSSSSAGGVSGGFKSTGSSSSRGPRG